MLHLPWAQGVGGSNPLAPTNGIKWMRALFPGMCCKNGRETELRRLSGARELFSTQSEGRIYEQDQPNHVPFGQPPHLAFPDHVHRFAALAALDYHLQAWIRVKNPGARSLLHRPFHVPQRGCLDMGFVGKDTVAGAGEVEHRTVSFGARRVNQRWKRKTADSRAWNPPLVYSLAADSFRR